MHDLSVCLSVCVCLLVTFVGPAKTAEPIEMPFMGLIRVVPMNHLLDAGQTNRFTAAKDDKLAMRPFAKLLWTLLKLPPFDRP